MRRLRARLWCLGAIWGMCALARAQEGVSPLSEEAADFARRAALSALHGPRKIFLESIDADGILRRLLGSAVFGGLTLRQQELLRSTVRDRFAEALAPAFGASSEVRWAWVPPIGQGPVLVSVGIHYGGAMLKTRWMVSRAHRDWSIEDIVLVDPGLSLAGEVGRLMGPRPVVRRNGAHEARARALPRLLALLGIAIGVGIISRRLPRPRRSLLWLTAAVPALLLVIDGGLAARRAFKEEYSLVETLPPQRWREFEKLALEAQRAGNGELARAAWQKAVDADAPRAAVYYQLGLLARAQGDVVQARRDFERALSERPPAPGAGKELALIALAEGRHADARAGLEAYIDAAGPDPDTLATLAVVLANLGDTAGSVHVIESARALIGESWRKAELEAQIYARSGNASSAVAALRPLEAQGRLDRWSLRADPAYLSIAMEPAWVAFLNEEPSPPTTPSP